MDATFDRPVSGWLQSSIELHNGLDIAEFSDTLLPAYFDQLFRRQNPADKAHSGASQP